MVIGDVQGNTGVFGESKGGSEVIGDAIPSSPSAFVVWSRSKAQQKFQ